MTKKEQAQVEALLQKVRLIGALRWTSEVKPDIAPPDRGYTTGWNRNASLSYPSVDEGWSGSSCHGSGKPPAENQRHWSASQGARSLYSSRLLALKALRHSLEREAATILARVDAMIEAEEAKPDTKPTDTGED